MISDYPFVRFKSGARGFLERAREHMSAYRTGKDEVQRVFCAALELRFGIEARVSEYLKAAMSDLGRDPAELTDYVATKLLKRLTEIEPTYQHPAVLRLTNEHSGRHTVLEFTPVTPQLAGLHGKLGELLHYKFFLNNKHWQMKKPMGGKPHRSVGDFATLVNDGISQLAAHCLDICDLRRS